MAFSIIFLILLVNKTDQPKEISMPQSNNKNAKHNEKNNK